MDQPNRYQPITHDQVLERLTKVVQRWQDMHAESEREAKAEKEARDARLRPHGHQSDD